MSVIFFNRTLILNAQLVLQEDKPTVTTSPAPPMLYDYSGFPDEVPSFFYCRFSPSLVVEIALLSRCIRFICNLATALRLSVLASEATWIVSLHTNLQAYKITYDAPGDPTLAKKAIKLLR